MASINLRLRPTDAACPARPGRRRASIRPVGSL